MNEDAALLRDYARTRSEPAFAALVRRRFDLVHAAAVRQLGGDHHRACDVAQLVFVDLARKAASLAAHPSLAGWLYTATHHAVAKVKRDEQRRAAREREAAQAEPSGTAAPGTAADWAVIRSHLDAELLALGAADRTALLLRFFDRRGFADVGEALGVTENAARMKVGRALEKLRVRLSRRGVTAAAAGLAAALSEHAVLGAPAGASASVTAACLGQLASPAGAGLALHLMANKIVLGAAAACTLVATGTGLYFAALARPAKAEQAALLRQCAQLQSGLDARPGDSANSPPVSGGSRPAGSTSPGATARAEANDDALNREIAENPELRHALGTQYLAAFRLKYAALAARLGLTEAQFSQWAWLDLKLKSDLFDAQQAARLSGDNAQNPALAGLEQKITAQHDADVQQLVGADGWARVRQFDREYPARAAARQVAAAALGTAPLSAADTEGLAQLLLESDPAFQAGGTFDWDALDWAAVQRRAAAGLPASQATGLALLQSRREMKAMRSTLEDASGVP